MYGIFRLSAYLLFAIWLGRLKV